MRATDFVMSYFDCWNHCDAEGVADHLTDDGVYYVIPENQQFTHDALVTNLRKYFAAARLRYELIGDILAKSNTIAFQYRMSPLTNGRKSRPQDVVHGAEFITLHDRAAVTIHDYYYLPGSERTAPFSGPPRGDHSKYAKSGLGQDKLAEYKVRLEQLMQEQIYLRPELTLPELASAVDCSVNHLSQVINAGFGMSYFDYLNRHRIEHARRLLAEPDTTGDAVINVAFAAGFNSNSAFYTAFRKYVGQTPTEYRRRFAAEPHG